MQPISVQSTDSCSRLPTCLPTGLASSASGSQCARSSSPKAAFWTQSDSPRLHPTHRVCVVDSPQLCCLQLSLCTGLSKLLLYGTDALSCTDHYSHVQAIMADCSVLHEKFSPALLLSSGHIATIASNVHASHPLSFRRCKVSTCPGQSIGVLHTVLACPLQS